MLSERFRSVLWHGGSFPGVQRFYFRNLVLNALARDVPTLIVGVIVANQFPSLAIFSDHAHGSSFALTFKHGVRLLHDEKVMANVVVGYFGAGIFLTAPYPTGTF